MYTVHFVGLNYFNACTAGSKEALIPDGTKPDRNDHVPKHRASLFIEAAHCHCDNWWTQYRHRRKITLEYKLGHFRTVDVFEFQIPKTVELEFPCRKGGFKNVNLDAGLPKLEEIEGFHLAKEPKIIANVPLPGGELEVFRFGSSALVRWLITHHDEPIKIIARARRDVRYITLKRSDPQLPTEIVFSNTVDLLTAERHEYHCDKHDACTHDGPMNDLSLDHSERNVAGMHGAGIHEGAHSGGGHGFAGHFVLYAKLDENPDECRYENPNLPDFAQLSPLPFSHPYLTFLSTLEEVPDAPCVPSCCGGGGGGGLRKRGKYHHG